MRIFPFFTFYVLAYIVFSFTTRSIFFSYVRPKLYFSLYCFYPGHCFSPRYFYACYSRMFFHGFSHSRFSVSWKIPHFYILSCSHMLILPIIVFIAIFDVFRLFSLHFRPIYSPIILFFNVFIDEEVLSLRGKMDYFFLFN